ncbi:MAG: glycoside-pentoside-hexuronide (GPH):cation symporter [bacterium]
MPDSETAKTGTAGLSTLEKVGYGSGDLASNIIFQMVVNFLAYYYTDVFGISAATVGTVFLVVRIMDAVTDPIMGAICDRTNTRWGKYRPYMLWLAIPFGASAVLAFATPELAESGKTLYALVTYAILMLMYTAINIPYCALGSALTSDSSERISVQSWRFVGGQAGGLLVMSCTLPLVIFFGQGNEAFGYRATMALMSAVAVVMFIACFLMTRERVQGADSDLSMNIGQDLKALWDNDQWRLTAAMNFFLLLAIVMRSTVTIYYVEYVMLLPDAATSYFTLGFIGGIVGSLIAGSINNQFKNPGLMFVFAIQFGLLLLYYLVGVISLKLLAIGFLAGLAGAVICSALVLKFSRNTSFTLILVCQALAHFALYFFDQETLGYSFFFFVLVMVLNQVAVPMLWAMMSDTVDYGTWKNGLRIPGMNFSANLFSLKLGVAVGGALAGWMLAFYGYAPNVAQTEQSLQGIKMIFAIYPGIGCLVVALVSLNYRLSESRMSEIQSQLQLRLT